MPAAPWISVIIPALNEEAYLQETLDELELPPAAEVLVVDGSEGAPATVAGHPEVRWLKGPRGRALQQNRGAAAARGEVLLFLHADTRLPRGALPSVERALRPPRVVGGAFSLRFDSRRWGLRFIQACANLRARLFKHPYGDQALFVRRSVFEALGGFRKLEIMEDLDLVQRLGRRGRVVVLREQVTTSSRRFLANGLLRTVLVNRLAALLFGLGVSSRRIHHLYEALLPGSQAAASKPFALGHQGRVRTSLLLALLLASFLGLGFFFRQDLGRFFFAPPAAPLREAYGGEKASASFSQQLLNQVLAAHVSPPGAVDYAGLKRDQKLLDRYIQSLASAPFDKLGRNGRLAFLINAYNACTLRLILDYWPLSSIKEIPAEKRWKARRWRVGGRTLSLTEIETNYLRGRFREPRIHFAINCASRSCPPLRNRAYSALHIEQELQEQARKLHQDPGFLSFDAGTGRLLLNPIYDWYRGDFEQVAGSIQAFAARFRPDLQAALKAGQEIHISFRDYDWSLNGK